MRHLRLFGNVRLACKSASVSAQTAYRARHRSAGFAMAWDAALVAARAHAEATLADRAINGVEEAVYYHGEEVARRTRYSDRLLLAHLARLDKLEEREGVSAALARLDDAIDALEAEGADLDALMGVDGGAENVPQDRVPGVPSCRETAPGEGGEGAEALPAMEARLQAMEAARPKDAPTLAQQARRAACSADRTREEPDGGFMGEIEALQLYAFEAGIERWWEVT